VCSRPAPHADRYPRSLCDDCTARAADSAGRRVRGFNTSLSGGFEARHLGPDGVVGEICHEVTAGGRCWVDDHECSIGEARFGGVVVEG